MSDSSPTLIVDNEATVAVRYCPKCKAANPVSQLVKSEYLCKSCGFEMAYLDVSTSGVVRGVLGWVRREGEVIQQRYHITQLLGRGGFGSTYLVEDLQLNGKRRALKEIPKNMFNEAESLLLARLDHPAIPDIVDRLHNDNMVYLVLKFGGTRTLGSERKRLGGKIPLAMLTPWIHQLCRVLSYLHAQNPPIIHRDLKPDNILLDEQDNVMLIDFGIAKLANPNEETRTLGRAVSFGFSPPEQIMGTGTDQRSDIYSLGATVYFLLTGLHPPPLNVQLSGKKLEPLSRLVPDVPPSLDQAISKALDINPDRRQQSIRDLFEIFEDLERTIPRRAPKADIQADHQRKNLIILMSLLLGLMIIGILAVLLWRSESQQKVSPDTPSTPGTAPTAPRPLRIEPTTPTPSEPAPPTEKPSEIEDSSVSQPVHPEPAKPLEQIPRSGETMPPAAGQKVPEKEVEPAPVPAKPPVTSKARQPSSAKKAPISKPQVKEAVPLPKPKPQPQPKIAKPAKPKPAAPQADWGGAWSRGETIKKNP